MQEKQLICINCPIGCRLTAKIEDGVVTEVTGNTCPRGKRYAEQECVHPERTVTTTVRCIGGELRMLPVKTSRPIPKELIFDCIAALKDVSATAPVAMGSVIVENILGTGADIVAARNIDKQ